MDGRTKEEFGLLYARLDDLAARSARGEVAISPFFSPREQYFAMQYLTRCGVRALSFGGVRGAERRRLYLLPDYMEAEEDTLPEVLAEFGVESDISAVLVQGSGYRTLTHRDFLGSLLGLGVSRAVLGDILVEEQRNAVLLCENAIVPFLLSHVERVGNDKVRTSLLSEEALGSLSVTHRTSSISDTVASERLDCVVAALCRLSRERARECVLSELVELNFAVENRPDRTVEAPAMLSVRGVGRFRVLALSDLTKKGRIRLLAEKYE